MDIKEKRAQVRQTYLEFHGNHKADSWNSIPAVEPIANIEDFPNVWVWSDIHFGHKKIIEYSDRPFEDTPLMDAQLIENFNSTVGKDDLSIWVGDVSFYNDYKTRTMIYKLNGYKILVVGNHDFDHGKLKHMAFDEEHLTYVLPLIEGSYLIFTHYPSPVTFPDVNVHGHRHIKKAKTEFCDLPSHINVCCEFHNYKPLNLRDIKAQAKERISEYESSKKQKRW